MIPTIQVLVLLLIVISAVSVLAKRLDVSPPILLVLTGVVLAVIPGLPKVSLAPEFVLLLVLPPVVYWSAVSMSWREFKFNLRPITLLAIGAVIFTTVVIAAVAHFLLGFDWPVGFVLGAIVSPPDPVAPLSIARGLKLPRRIAVILEGEGLANDATALILYRFAVAAVATGTFSLGQASVTFVAIIVGEILWGIGVGWVMLRLRHWVNEPRIELVLSILTPFLAYWPPQYLGGSGVLATVTAGLYVSWNGQRLIGAATRLQGVFFWNFFIYVIDGMVFLITGLQARAVIHHIGDMTSLQVAIAAVVVSAAVIAARFIWMFPATYLPVWLIPAIARDDPPPAWQRPFVMAFTGIRGIVSLAAALAIPLTTDSGAPFPHRDLILFLTFCVILVTLVGQGLLLPTVIRALGLARAGHREIRTDTAEEYRARERAVEAAMQRLDVLKAERDLPEAIVRDLRTQHESRLERIEQRSSDGRRKLSDLHDEIDCLLIEAERDAVNALYRAGELKDEPRRRIERDLDLRAAHIANMQSEP
ncbi:MAG TPA: Na+/H+ antiporter [Rhizomicrobium sp.]|nr:Na+/H+ antiporter [Rhizomicrobium sp.]